jgi:hypothetical protein
MNAVGSFETSVKSHTARYNIPEISSFNSQELLKCCRSQRIHCCSYDTSVRSSGSVCQLYRTFIIARAGGMERIIFANARIEIEEYPSAEITSGGGRWK